MLKNAFSKYVCTYVSPGLLSSPPSGSLETFPIKPAWCHTVNIQHFLRPLSHSQCLCGSHSIHFTRKATNSLSGCAAMLYIHALVLVNDPPSNSKGRIATLEPVQSKTSKQWQHIYIFPPRFTLFTVQFRVVSTFTSSRKVLPNASKLLIGTYSIKKGENKNRIYHNLLFKTTSSVCLSRAK